MDIGCCGAYRRTCLPSLEIGVCSGCKLGYEDGKRDINKSKSKIKIVASEIDNLKPVLIVLNI